MGDHFDALLDLRRENPWTWTPQATKDATEIDENVPELLIHGTALELQIDSGNQNLLGALRITVGVSTTKFPTR